MASQNQTLRQLLTIPKNDWSGIGNTHGNFVVYPPASKARREVANLTQRKILIPMFIPSVHKELKWQFYTILYNPSSTGNQKPFQKSLLLWMPHLFLLARFHPFCLKSVIFVCFQIPAQTCTIPRGYEIFLKNFTST